MSVQIWTYIIVGITFALYIGIAIWSRAGSTKEFYVAGGGVGPLANGLATAADWMSAASFISMAGLISFMGYDGTVYLMGWTGGYVLLALLLAPYLRKFGKFTVPDFIGDRYYSKTARSVAVVCALIVSFTYVAGQMRGVGVVFSRFLEVDINTGVLIGMIIVLFYAVLGGMKGITYTQVAQYCVLIFAFMVPAIFISIQMTGNPIPQMGMGGTLADGSGTYLIDKLNGLSTELGFAEYTSGSKPMIDVFAITLALMVGTAGLPHVIIRFFTVKRVKDARKSAGLALLFIAILYTTAPAVAVFARTNLIETVSNKEYADMPEWFSKWEETGLLSFDDKNQDGVIQYVVDASVNELTIDNDIIRHEKPEGVIVQLGGQTALKLAEKLDRYGIKIIGTTFESLDLAEDRGSFSTLLKENNIPYPEFGVAETAEEALKIADELDFPLLVRPSYVLGGQGMKIVINKKELEEHVVDLLRSIPNNKLLLDHYLDGAIEAEADAICDGENVYIIGIMEHIEPCGIHSGDSNATLPPFNLGEFVLQQIKDHTKKIALALNTVGLINIQFAIKDDMVYIIEANPRASRTVPFIAKAYGEPYVNYATKVMLGEKKVTDFDFNPQLNGFAIKQPVFSFNKFPNVNKQLGPEMKSTGESILFIKDLKDDAFYELYSRRKMYLSK